MATSVCSNVVGVDKLHVLGCWGLDECSSSFLFKKYK